MSRPEEAYLYKYMKERPERAKVVDKSNYPTADDEAEEDPEIEAFADEAMEAEMKKMAGGFDADAEDLSDGDEPLSEGADLEAGDFFSGEEDLQEVELGGEDGSEYGDQEGNEDGSDAEMGGGIFEGEVESYGSQDEDGGQEIPNE